MLPVAAASDGHLGEDRGAEALQLGGQEGNTVAGHGAIVRGARRRRRRPGEHQATVMLPDIDGWMRQKIS